MEDTPKQFLKRLFDFSIGPFISAFIGFLMVPITTYFIDPSEMGKSSMYFLAVSISTLFVYLGLDQAFVREFNEQKNKKNLFWNSIIVPLLFSFLVAGICLLFYKPISLLIFGSVEWYIMKILAISLPFTIIDRFNMLILRMEEKAKLYSFLNIANKLIGMTVLIVYLVFIDRSFKGIIISNVINLIIMCVLELYLLRDYWLFKFKIDKKLQKKLFQFGLPLVPATIISWILNSMDKIAMRQWSDFNQIGLYAAALKIVMVLTVVQQAFSTFWAPTAYRWYEDDVEKEKFDRVSKTLTAFMCIVFAFIVLFKDQIILILNYKYKDAAVIVPFLLFLPLMYTISETTTLGISFKRKTSYNIIISCVSAAVNFFGNYMLVPKYGGLGAAISTGISYIIFFWLRTLISRKLWYKFDIMYYFWNILFMLAMASLDILYNNMFINLAFFIVICIYNYKIFYYIISLLKKRKEDVNI